MRVSPRGSAHATDLLCHGSAGGLGVWGNTLGIPSVATAISLVLLLVQIIYLLLASRNISDSQDGGTHGTTGENIGSGERAKTRIDNLGGGRTVVLKAIRVVSCIFLLGSVIYLVLEDAFPREMHPWIQYGLCATYVRAISNIRDTYPPLIIDT